MMIQVWLDEVIGLYSIAVDGNTILECLSEEEVENLTLKELFLLAKSEIV